jgi:ABC-2 type transport system permease protein
MAFRQTIQFLTNQIYLSLVVVRKNIRIYYFKGPVITFGIVFPLFFFLAFAAGKEAPIELLIPGIIAMSVFFSSSAVGPLITPWERQARTYERLVTSPAALLSIIMGDVLAGALFGVLLSLVPILISLFVLKVSVADLGALILGVTSGSLMFSSLGVLMASPASDSPSQVMMLSNLVRLPLIFVSGVFTAHSEMPLWGQKLTLFSPLSYCADLIRIGFGAKPYWSVGTDVSVSFGFLIAFLLLSNFIHTRSQK